MVLRENPPNQDSTSVLLRFAFVIENTMFPGSIHTFWYKVSAENDEKMTSSKKGYISQQ